MLESLKVKNVALIDESELNFENGLNILTGETGAGKSILIDSIQLALGAKADKSLIRKGCEYAYVELSFLVENNSVIKRLKEMEIFPDEDNRVILTRRIMPSKSVCRMNGEAVNGKALKEAASVLIDIHGQMQHHSLLDEKKHLDILDKFCPEEMKKLSISLADAYDSYRALSDEVEELCDTKERERDISLAQFEWKEIQEAAPVEGEDEQLEAAFKKMDNVRFLGETVSRVQQCLDCYDAPCVLSLTDMALKDLGQAAECDSDLQQYQESLSQSQEVIHDVSRQLSRYIEQLEIDPQEYEYTRQRLDLINRLKSKYGNTISDILAYADEKRAFLDKYEDFEVYKEQKIKQRDEALTKYLELARKISAIRNKQAKKLAKEMQNSLLELNFSHVNFEIAVYEDEKYASRSGINQVQFMISLNAGEDLKPLSQVASGGELSRIMLALKTVMADQDEIETLIFDEIDAGISGRTAWKVSEKLALLGKRHQVICITHLPQIAAMADTHFLIEKKQSDNQTQTNLRKLARDGMLEEIARLLGSDALTKKVLDNAEELKKQADEVKSSFV